MTASILRHTYPTPQPAPVVRNNAGGTSHTVDMWNRLNRFLIIGTEGGTYYVNELRHTLDNVQSVRECLEQDYNRVVDTIVEVSNAGRAPKNDYAIYALAMAASDPRPACRSRALAALPTVCRTGTHLFQFIEVIDKMRGWGSGLRKAVANWYLSKDPDQLAYQVLKYQQRNGWSHRDVLRKVHPKGNLGHDLVFAYVTQGKANALTPDLILRVDRIKELNDPTETAYAIRHHNVSREMIPTEHMNALVVQEALAEKMPYTALMRNLGNLSKRGIVTEDMLARLTSEPYIQKSRVHPISILTALRTYAQGSGYRSDNSWPVFPEVVQALDSAFYRAFKNVEPTGKRFMLGIDVSGSMSSRFGDGILSSHEIASALAMLLNETENTVKPYIFNLGIQSIDLHRGERLDRVMKRLQPFNGGGTDASLLMEYALKHQIPTDVFVVITDNETWGHRRQPSDVIKEYRRVMGIDAKLIVLATAATSFSIADPNDPGMLDIAGFDSSVPDIMREFVLGHI